MREKPVFFMRSASQRNRGESRRQRLLAAARARVCVFRVPEFRLVCSSSSLAGLVGRAGVPFVSRGTLLSTFLLPRAVGGCATTRLSQFCECAPLSLLPLALLMRVFARAHLHSFANSILHTRLPHPAASFPPRFVAGRAGVVPVLCSPFPLLACKCPWGGLPSEFCISILVGCAPTHSPSRIPLAHPPR